MVFGSVRFTIPQWNAVIHRICTEVHMWAHTHTHTHTHIHTHTHTYIHTDVYMAIHVHTHTHTHACMHACTQMYTCTYMYKHTHNVYMYIHVHTHRCIHAHTCVPRAHYVSSSPRWCSAFLSTYLPIEANMEMESNKACSSANSSGSGYVQCTARASVCQSKGAELRWWTFLSLKLGFQTGWHRPLAQITCRQSVLELSFRINWWHWQKSSMETISPLYAELNMSCHHIQFTNYRIAYNDFLGLSQWVVIYDTTHKITQDVATLLAPQNRTKGKTFQIYWHETNKQTHTVICTHTYAYTYSVKSP